MNIKNILKNIKLHESTISIILGALIIIISGILVVNYFGNRKGEITTGIETESTNTLPTKHVIKEGEDLWKIAEKYYGSGYNWIDIAKENNITNPDEISVGGDLIIPDVKPRLAGSEVTPTIQEDLISPTFTSNKDTIENDKYTHTVVAGENLWKIAEKYYGNGYKWRDIAKINNLTTFNKIEIGQKLIIPQEVSKTEVTTQNNLSPITGSTYTVVKGDSLWMIALRAYGDGYKWIDIARENHLVNPNIIHSGNTFTLPR